VLLLSGLFAYGVSGAVNEAVGLFFPQLLHEFATLPAGRMALVASSFTAGNALGLVFAGPLGDSRGRRWLARRGVLGAILASLLVLGAPSVATFLLARALLGICAGFFTVAIPTMITEGCPPRIVNTFLSIYPCGWPLGALACIAVSSSPWRYALGGIPFLLCLPLAACLLWLPESPQFLLAKGRNREAAIATDRLGLRIPSAPTAVAADTGARAGEVDRPQISFKLLGLAFMLRHVASEAVKVWLPVWLGSSMSGDVARAMIMMYVLEALGILGTASIMRRVGAGSESQTCGPLASGARLSFAMAFVATLGCLLCRGSLVAAGCFGGMHLIAQANANNLLTALTCLIASTEERARILARFSLLSFIAGGLGPLMLSCMVSIHEGAFHGIGSILASAAVLYAVAAVISPSPLKRAELMGKGSQGTV